MSKYLQSDGLALICCLLSLILSSVSMLPWRKSSPAAGGAQGGGAAFIKGIDKDNDGLLSKAKVMGTTLEADFKKIDANKDERQRTGKLRWGWRSTCGWHAACC